MSFVPVIKKVEVESIVEVDATGQGDVPVTLDGEAVAVTNAGLTKLAAAIDTEVQCDIVGALPAGSNAIGKLAANSGVDIGEVMGVDLDSDLAVIRVDVVRSVDLVPEE